jgi:hypothetical protein
MLETSLMQCGYIKKQNFIKKLNFLKISDIEFELF